MPTNPLVTTDQGQVGEVVRLGKMRWSSPDVVQSCACELRLWRRWIEEIGCWLRVPAGKAKKTAEGVSPWSESR